MRYFLDTEYNGHRGALISLALVPEHGDQEFYAVLELAEAPHDWVTRNVIPYLGAVPPGHDSAARPREEVAAEVARFLAADREPEIAADWPEDIALFCMLLLTGPADIVDIGSIRFEFLRNPGFSPSRNSRVPHNALHDARALRDFAARGY